MKPKQRDAAIDPPPEMFQRTPEQIAADRAELDAETARLKAEDEAKRARTPEDEAAARAAEELLIAEMQRKLADARRAIGPATGEPSLATIDPDIQAIAAASARAEHFSAAWQAERQSLPCWSAIFPFGAPARFLEVDVDHRQLVAGRAACHQANARDACEYKHSGVVCVWERVAEQREQARRHLDLGQVEEEEVKLILRSVDPDHPVRLKPFDPLVLVRAWIRRERCEVRLQNAAEVAPLTGELGERGVVRLSGDERLVIFGGNPGRGKTGAAAYAIARLGGLYVTEYQLGGDLSGWRARETVDRIVGVGGVVVIDQVQPREDDPRRRVTQREDEIAHRRFAAGRDTLMIGNVNYETWGRRFGTWDETNGKVQHPGVICERAAQAGLFVLFGGPSLRADPMTPTM